MLNRRIKKILDDIIDVAYSGTPATTRNKYKNFILELQSDEKASINGSYQYDKHLIKVNNPSRGEGAFAKTCLHELSHHIDFIDNGKSGHKAPFYDRYAKLIYAALDMKILTPDDMMDKSSSDYRQVKKIVEAYIPRQVQYDTLPKTYIKVKNCFGIKEELKENGFKWNNLEQTWERRLSDKSEEFVKNLGIAKVDDKYSLPDNKEPYYYLDTPGIYVDSIIYFVVKNENAYQYKDALKEHHFFYDSKGKTWMKKVMSSMQETLLQELRDDERLNGLVLGKAKPKKVKGEKK